MLVGPSGAVVLAVIYILILLAAIIIVARIYFQLAIVKQRFIIADWLRILAWCSAFISGLFDVFHMKEGVLHAEIGYTLSNWDASPERLERMLKYIWANAIPFFTTFYLCKASLLIIYLQLFPPFMVIRRVSVWIVAVYCICAYIVTISLQLFLCFPIQRNWSILEPEKLCHGIITLVIFQVAWVLHFVGIFILPFSIIHNLHMRTQVKVSLYCIFLLGVVDIAFSLTRFLTIQLSNVGDFRSFTTIELWTSLDMYIGLIISCLPSLRPYLRRKVVDYNYHGSGRPSNSGVAARTTVQSGFEDQDEAAARPSSYNESNSHELNMGWNDKRSNGSDVELVSFETIS